MVKVYLTFMLLLTSCATKYIVPGNRFITPETNGGALKGQIEIQQTKANQVTIDASQGNISNGVNYSTVARTAFLFSESFFDAFDLFWSHIGSANSLIGAKLQVMGGSKAAKAAGHKLAFAAAIGANEHEPEDKSIEFKLAGNDLIAIYGYRFSEFLLPYISLSSARYDFSGTIKKHPTLAGQKPHFVTNILSLSPGLEVDYGPVVAKLEATYQQLETTDTKQKTNFILGWSLGYSW